MFICLSINNEGRHQIMTFSGKNWQLMNKAEHFQRRLESDVGLMLPSLYFPNYFLFLCF